MRSACCSWRPRDSGTREAREGGRLAARQDRPSRRSNAARVDTGIRPTRPRARLTRLQRPLLGLATRRDVALWRALADTQHRGASFVLAVRSAKLVVGASRHRDAIVDL